MKRNRPPLTADEIVFAKAARKAGRAWRKIGLQLRCDWEMVKRAVVPGFAEERAQQIRVARAPRTPRDRASRENHVNRRPDIPADVMTDCIARASAPRSLTSLTNGDPAPGQSALDKKLANLSTPPMFDPDNKVGLSP